uniref:Uncharacterized protein n=1 Tax=Romanomermis culicivorax TaxID=13658 RepID=A0A915JVF3_ROMCU
MLKRFIFLRSRTSKAENFLHYQGKSCANTSAPSSAFVRIPPTHSGEISVTTGPVSNSAACAAAASVVNMSLKRKVPPSNVESSVIDYRMRPEMHQ